MIIGRWDGKFWIGNTTTYGNQMGQTLVSRGYTRTSSSVSFYGGMPLMVLVVSYIAVACSGG